MKDSAALSLFVQSTAGYTISGFKLENGRVEAETLFSSPLPVHALKIQNQIHKKLLQMPFSNSSVGVLKSLLMSTP